MALSEEAAEHVKVLRDHISGRPSCALREIDEAVAALVGMLPRDDAYRCPVCSGGLPYSVVRDGKHLWCEHPPSTVSP